MLGEFEGDIKGKLEGGKGVVEGDEEKGQHGGNVRVRWVLAKCAVGLRQGHGGASRLIV